MIKESIISQSYSTGLILKAQKFISKCDKYRETNYKVMLQYIVYDIVGHGKTGGIKKGFEKKEQAWFFKNPSEAMAKFQQVKNKLDRVNRSRVKNKNKYLGVS